MIDVLLEDTRFETRAKMRFRPGENLGLQGPYLGQKPPELKPELFAPGIVSVFGSNENTVTISPDGRELYFGKESAIWVCRWTESGRTAPQNTGWPGYEMWISPESGKMYFTGYEPRIWAMERLGATWGKPQKLVSHGMFSTLTRDETLYTTVFNEKGQANIGRYAKKEGRYETAEVLGPEINSPNRFDAHPNAAPDGSFLLFDRQPPAGSGLYISFRGPDGTWSPAKSLGAEFDGSVSTFSPDGKYLFFMKHRDIYWVSAKVFDELRLTAGSSPRILSSRSGTPILDSLVCGGTHQMKKFAFLFCFFMAILANSVPAQSQEIFDLLRKGETQAIKALVEKSPQIVGAQDGNGMTPLHYAASGGSADLIHYFADKGAKLDLQNPQLKTPLHLAAANDRKDAVAALLKRGAPLEKQDNYGRTALILCARERGQTATGRILIEAGADVHAADKFGSTALELAAWRGKVEFVDLLLEKGARVPPSGSQWQGMLSDAASKGMTTLFRRLIEGKPDLKSVDPSGVHLLHSASAGGSAEIIGLLIDRGFEPVKPDRFGWTPLHYAARDGRAGAARVLIDRGAPIDIRTIMGQTPYNVAVERRMEAVAGLLAGKGADQSDARFPVLAGDYLGQKPPGDTPELFGLGIVSSIWGLHSTAVFSPDGNEVYWAPMMTFPGEIYSRGGLMMMKRVNGHWTAPTWVSFSGPYGNDDVPFFSADGKRIYFISRRPLPGETQSGSEKIWFADRTAGGWSAPQPLDPNVNSINMHWEFSLDQEGNVYLAGQPPDSRGLQDIYLARFSGGRYEKPVNLGAPINSAAGEETPFIAPDGSYLLFSRQFDLWVSFRGPDGIWSEPVTLGPEINSPSVELCPMVTADGKYLFFLSQRDGESHAYWARADIIEKRRPGKK